MRNEFVNGIMDSIEVAHILACPRLVVTTGNERQGVPRETKHQSIINRVPKEASY